jgi:hypothetical protein
MRLPYRLVCGSNIIDDLDIGSRVEQTLQSKANYLVIIHQQYSCVRHVTKYTRAGSTWLGYGCKDQLGIYVT